MSHQIESVSRMVSLVMIGAFLIAAGSAEAHRSERTLTASNIEPFDAGMNTEGASLLTRDDSEIWLEGYAGNLNRRYAYTIWFVIFNEPEDCSDSCGLDDLGLESASVLWGTGFIADNDGNGHFSAHLQEGNPLGPVLLGPGLQDAREAEVHFIIRCHGRLIPSLAAEQISTFNGGCNEGEPNEGQCEDVGAGVHLPPQ